MAKHEDKSGQEGKGSDGKHRDPESYKDEIKGFDPTAKSGPPRPSSPDGWAPERI